MQSLKDHPFAVEAHFDSSLVLTFAAPKERLQPLLPECLELDTFHGDTAFLAVAMVQTRGLRPKGFPAFMGNDFFLTGYRLFVRYTTSAGKRLRGLYILRSETDKPRMSFFGNIFTHYNYRTTDITLAHSGPHTEIVSKRSKLHVRTTDTESPVPLPAHSPFADWKEARRFAGPLPFTFTYDKSRSEVLIIEGVREHWDPEPVLVTGYEVGFLRELGLADLPLANAFRIRNIPYYWKKGKRDLWKPAAGPSRVS
ncbi:YqjF family protein [Flaviaesturariibacter terrae]